jgi:hypothetical protein
MSPIHTDDELTILSGVREQVVFSVMAVAVVDR